MWRQGGDIQEDLGEPRPGFTLAWGNPGLGSRWRDRCLCGAVLRACGQHVWPPPPHPTPCCPRGQNHPGWNGWARYCAVLHLVSPLTDGAVLLTWGLG